MRGGHFESFSMQAYVNTEASVFKEVFFSHSGCDIIYSLDYVRKSTDHRGTSLCVCIYIYIYIYIYLRIPNKESRCSEFIRFSVTPRVYVPLSVIFLTGEIRGGQVVINDIANTGLLFFHRDHRGSMVESFACIQHCLVC